MSSFGTDGDVMMTNVNELEDNVVWYDSVISKDFLHRVHNRVDKPDTVRP